MKMQGGCSIRDVNVCDPRLPRPLADNNGGAIE